MKRSISSVFLPLFLLTFTSIAGAADPVWTCATDAEVQWQKTAEFGYLVACTRDGLIGIDDEKGTVLWTNRGLAGMSEDALTEITGTPFFMVSHKGDNAIVDAFTGVKVFSSKQEGFTSVRK